MLTITEQKKQLRRIMREFLKTQDKTQKIKADAEICQKLCEDSWVQQADMILCYYAMPEEPATQKFISVMLKQGKKVALPKCNLHQKGTMDFYQIENLSSKEITAGAYGIPEPVKGNPAEFTEKSVIIVPALAFAQQGQRLGRGGGYYDRYLEYHSDLHKIGICYEAMLMQSLPHELHDCCVDRIITESNGGIL